jgi:hypothetical protein
MSDVKDFQDLIIWQKGMIIAEKCFFLTQKSPCIRIIWHGSTNKKSLIIDTCKYIRRLWTKIPWGL